MERLLVEATAKTPLIYMNAEKGLIEIKGRSTPEDIDKVYLPVLSWIDAYLNDPRPLTTVNFHFEYFNSSTTKALMRLINKLLVLHKSGNTSLEINWLYFDEDLLEYGEDFEELTGLSFNFIESDYSNIDFNIKNY
ncbi:MAG: DUF1987 domain-containing protein [Bacteroidales bacterium]|nr:DUF1987 domain-containing protein [Bacteroidales bacterium]